ncbi:hypothetical protein EVAR_782_1 [Eumeta japonica]|uniref:Uncharacterized protein n=1 Tax=Eumeta variegata TaxID=151549 RepID=A0A4C1SET4_EUMVA|nr:hypothetical protein EVAR_782_1 [Eumeta japonica]
MNECSESYLHMEHIRDSTNPTIKVDALERISCDRLHDYINGAALRTGLARGDAHTGPSLHAHAPAGTAHRTAAVLRGLLQAKMLRPTTPSSPPKMPKQA